MEGGKRRTDGAKTDGGDLNLHQLRLFCAIVESESVSRAAQLLFMSQPALTIQVRRLETSLGVRLIERRGRRVVVTPVGREVYERAKGMLMYQGLLQQAVAHDRAGRSRPLMVGSSYNILHLLAPRIKSYRNAHSERDVVVEVLAAERILGRVREGSLDVGFAWDYPSNADTVWLPVGVDDFVLVASAASAIREPVGREALGREPFIAVQNGPNVSYMEQECAKNGVRLNVAMRVPSVYDAAWLVDAGLGVSILPLSIVGERIASGRLRAVAAAGMPMHRTYGCLMRRIPNRSPHADRFVRFLSPESAAAFD